MKDHGIRNLLLLAFLATSMAITSPSTHAAWTQSIVDQTRSETIDLEVDSSGNPHLAYIRYANPPSYQGSIVTYASRNPTWNYIDIHGDLLSEHGHLSLAVDVNDVPHVAYLCVLNSGVPEGSLYYAKAPAWTPVLVDGSNLGAYNSIAVNAAGEPRISYFDRGNLRLKFAKYQSGSWNVEAVNTDGEGGSGTSLILDSADNPHISFLNITGDVYYAHHDGTSWTIQLVDNTNLTWSGFYTSIALDPVGRPIIAYTRAPLDCWSGNGDMMIARFDGVSWTMETVNDFGHVGVCPSLITDGSGYTQLVYGNWSSGPVHVKYSRWDSIQWVHETITREAWLFYPNRGNDIVAYGGEVKIAYNGTSYNLMLLEGPPDQATPTPVPPQIGENELWLEKSVDRTTAMVGETLTYTIVYQNQNLGKKADIIWIIDASTSMNEYQNAIADNASSFIVIFPDADIRFGVVCMAYSGFLKCKSRPVDLRGCTAPGIPPCSPTSDMTSDQELFVQMVTQVGTRGMIDPHNWEWGLWAAEDSVQNYTFRPDAQKVFIIVSDECDGGIYSTGDFPANPILVDAINVMLANDVIVYVIGVAPIDKNGIGTGHYYDTWGIAQQTGGAWHDITSADWSSTLGLIGQDIYTNLSVKDVVLIDTLASQLTYRSADAPADALGPPLEWDIGELKALEKGTVTLLVEVTSLGDGYVENAAYISAPYATPGYDEAQTVVLITKTATPTPFLSSTATHTSTISPTPTASPTYTVPTTTPTSTATPTFTRTPSPQLREIVVYPNPFNPDKAFGGTLKFRGLPDGARIAIYTVSGELVRELGEQNGAAYWNARTKAGGMVSMGSYVYVIRVGKETIKRGKVVVTR